MASDRDAIEVGWAEDMEPDQMHWLTKALASGATRDIAAKAAKIPDLDERLKSDDVLREYVEALEARAEVDLLIELREKRAAFILERTRPDRYGPVLSRGFEGADEDVDLFGEG